MKDLRRCLCKRWLLPDVSIALVQPPLRFKFLQTCGFHFGKFYMSVSSKDLIHFILQLFNKRHCPGISPAQGQEKVF